MAIVPVQQVASLGRHGGSMANDAADGKPRPPVGQTGSQPGSRAQARHVYGPRALASLLPPIVRPAFKARSPAAAQVMADWPALVGPQLAAMAAPRRMSGGTLTLAANGPAALELQHLLPQLIARINGALGCRLVERVRFVQHDPAAGVAALPPRAADPAPVAVALPDGPLHDALARLGGRIAARSPT